MAIKKTAKRQRVKTTKRRTMKGGGGDRLRFNSGRNVFVPVSRSRANIQAQRNSAQRAASREKRRARQTRLYDSQAQNYTRITKSHW